jgi:type IV pilus assembly protein PilW
MSRADLVENGPIMSTANPLQVDPSYALPAELTGFAGTINQCGNFWAVKLPTYVEATDSYTLGCPAAGNGAVAGSDTLTIRRVSTQVIAPAALGASAGQIKIQTSRVQGSLFSSGALPAGYLPPLSETRALVINGYYVGQDSDERAGTPSLRRKQLDVAGAAPTITDLQIVPGIEDLQIEFGADFNNDQNADYFVQPNTAIPAGDQVVAVRVWLLVRAEQPDTGYTDSRTYTYASRTGAGALTPGDSFHRVLVSKTIALRNTRR